MKMEFPFQNGIVSSKALNTTHTNVLLGTALILNSLHFKTRQVSSNTDRQYVSVIPLMSRFPKTTQLAAFEEIFDASATEMFSHVFCFRSNRGKEKRGAFLGCYYDYIGCQTQFRY